VVVGCGVNGFISEGSIELVHLCWHTVTCSLQKTAVKLQLCYTWLNGDNSLLGAIICCTPIIRECNTLIAPTVEVCHLEARSLVVTFCLEHDVNDNILRTAQNRGNSYYVGSTHWPGLTFTWKNSVSRVYILLKTQAGRTTATVNSPLYIVWTLQSVQKRESMTGGSHEATGKSSPWTK